MAWNINLSPTAVRLAKERMRKKREIEQGGSDRGITREGVPYRFNEDGTRKYYPEMAPPGNRSSGNGLLGGLGTRQKDVTPGREPPPEIVVDKDYFNNTIRNQFQGKAIGPNVVLPKK